MTRRLERDASGADDLEVVLRLARSHLRTGRGEDALEALGGQRAPAALAVLAEALLSLNRVHEAADAAGDARFADPGSVEPALRSEISRRLVVTTDTPLTNLEQLLLTRRMSMLQDDDALSVESVLSASLLMAAQRVRAPALRDLLRDAERPLVRAVARGAIGVPKFFDEAVPTRLFSAHGPDFESGTFVAFEASCEDRLAYFNTSLFREVAKVLELDGRQPAFGRGYGLAIPYGEVTGDIDDRVAAMNEAMLLPFALGVHHHQPFDVLVGDEPDGVLSPLDARLAWRFAQDLARHPARMNDPQARAPYARLLGAFRRNNPSAEFVEARMKDARSAYGPVGVRALELFAVRARSDNDSLAARRESRL